jgi:glycosyltransferase involved in cell wall biosynthesis
MLETWPVLRNRLVPGLEPRQLRSAALVEILARTFARGSLRRVRTYDAVFWAHDRAVAAMPWPPDVAVAYAYEDAALATFGRARKRDILRIWDLPAPHHCSRERVWRDEPARWPGAASAEPGLEPEWKRRRKDAELELATGVVVASAYTHSTLRAAGYRGPVEVVPYGFPVRQFPPKAAEAERPFTVLAVGTQGLAKGTPYLLEAWRLAGVEGQLRLVGEMRLGRAFLDRYSRIFDHVPHLPRARLGAEYRQADLVVFPSLGDGFGLVIQEAMCSGTPVVATRCSGGPECITDGEDGWLVPERCVEALVECIRKAARDRDRLRDMGRAARARAERWTWEDAGAAMASAVERLSSC